MHAMLVSAQELVGAAVAMAHGPGTEKKKENTRRWRTSLASFLFCGDGMDAVPQPQPPTERNGRDAGAAFAGHLSRVTSAWMDVVEEPG